MSYDYKETDEEIIIDKGIATRQMWKEYDHGKEYVSFDELTKACRFRDKIPVVLDSTHDHAQPLLGTNTAIGYAILKPCPDKHGLRTQWHLDKTRLPAELLAKIRKREPLPVSIFQFTNVDASGEQRDLLFDHIAILTEQDPRCPIERCGVGVYDSKMSEPDDSPDPSASGSEAVPVEPGETKEPPAPKKPLEPEPGPTDAVQAKDDEIAALKAELDKTKTQVKAIRDPLVAELTQRGYQAQELNPLSITTLQKMVTESRSATTERLPGTVPAPSSADTPKTLAEQRDAEQDRFEKALKKQADDRFKGW